jgi:hypothetical protein
MVHSWRSATQGSTRMALRAGTWHVSKATKTGNNEAPNKLDGSAGVTPYSMLEAESDSQSNSSPRPPSHFKGGAPSLYFENFGDRWFGSRAQNEQET